MKKKISPTRAVKKSPQGPQKSLGAKRPPKSSNTDKSARPRPPRGERRSTPAARRQAEPTPRLEIKAQLDFQEQSDYVRPWLPTALRPELLAPAGSKAAWAAAVEAEADAIYLGLNNFSARTYADNFSLAELKGIIEESHRLGLKIYLTMNSLIKETEMKEAWQLLSTAVSFGPDALILQDLGLNRLAAKYFPKLERHASTLMASHSLPGIMVLENLGFKRAVLARELALDEVRALSLHSPIGLEIFIHGALCFSFSGLCLMSSFLGGRSALRGGCTQPCRRAYTRGGHKHALFSTTDFAAAPYLRELRELPLASFKIEGRMKGPDYVARVVSAYRLLLDAPDHDWEAALVHAQELLSEAPGRKLSSGLLGAKKEGALAPLGSTTSGLKIGYLKNSQDGEGQLKVDKLLKLGDRLRLELGAGSESPAFNVKGLMQDGHDITEAGPGTEVIIFSPKMPNGRGPVFKVASGSEEKVFLNSPLVKAVRKIAENAKLPAPKALPPDLKPGTKVPAKTPPKAPAKMGLWLWLDRAEDLLALQDIDYQKVVLSLTAANVRHIKNTRRRLKTMWSKIVWSLPPLVFYEAQKSLRSELALLLNLGFNEFMASNLGHFNIIQRLGTGLEISDLKIWADHRLGILNHLAEEELYALGASGLTLSLEIDGDTAKALWPQKPTGGRLLYLYGRPALFTSRFPLDKRKIPIFSPKGEKFRLAEEGKESIVLSEKPIFMAPYLKMPPLAGGAGLIIDLRQETHLENTLRNLKKALNDGKSTQGSAVNFKRGLM